MRRGMVYGGLMVMTMVAGLAVRYGPLGLPWMVMKYGGSMMWAMMIYWLLCMAVAGWRPVRLAATACAIAAVLEFSRLWHYAPLDAFRMTAPGVLLLGKYFSFSNIAAYWFAIGLAALVDELAVRRRVLPLHVRW